MSAWRQLRDRVVLYTPILLMALLAMISYWLVRNAPQPGAAETQAAPRHVADYFMHDFSVRLFDAQGKLKSELTGKKGRHYPDTDTVEIDQVFVRTYNPEGRVTTAHAQRGLTNADGTEVQLFGNAVIVREPFMSKGQRQPKQELHSEFLHLFADTEAIRTHLPVEMWRGDQDRFVADSMDYDNLDRVLRLKGHVRGDLQPRKRAEEKPLRK